MINSCIKNCTKATRDSVKPKNSAKLRYTGPWVGTNAYCADAGPYPLQVLRESSLSTQKELKSENG